MDPNARRAVILDAAQKLFVSRGWDVVTVADVLKACGLSKGGFYHHFNAKNDLLIGILERISHRVLEAAEAAERAQSGNAIAQLNAFIAGATRWKAEHVPEIGMFADMLTKPGNDVLYSRILEVTAKATQPVLRRIITTGEAEGTFDVTDPDTVAEAVMNLAHGRRDVLIRALSLATRGEVDDAVRLLDARMVAEGALVDRLLGLPNGSVHLSNPEEFRKLLSRIAGPAKGGEA